MGTRTVTEYPLRDSKADELITHSGRPLSDITADAIDAGELTGEDLRTHADTLRQQAQIARQGGYPQLAANLQRAAELTDVPNEELLKIYELLRPERASFEELLRLADYLEDTYDAAENAAFIKDAAAVYRERNLLRR
ncbi:MAG: glycerol dehydrogenase [Chloroflexi bacterium]|nr:glycerol dehydrogenase [Chloroflexota bacterium]